MMRMILILNLIINTSQILKKIAKLTVKKIHGMEIKEPRIGKFESVNNHENVYDLTLNQYILKVITIVKII